MAQDTVKKVLLTPVVGTNPIALQILGVCSALAVTSKMETAFVIACSSCGNGFLTCLFQQFAITFQAVCVLLSKWQLSIARYCGGPSAQSLCL